jgi:hypothetical protein
VRLTNLFPNIFRGEVESDGGVHLRENSLILCEGRAVISRGPFSLSLIGDVQWLLGQSFPITQQLTPQFTLQMREERERDRQRGRQRQRARDRERGRETERQTKTERGKEVRSVSSKGSRASHGAWYGKYPNERHQPSRSTIVDRS